jgi:hypothetical protein
MNQTKTKFFFKSRKEKDDNGNVVMVDEVDKDNKPTGKKVEKVIPAAPTLEIEIPLLAPEDIVAIFQGGDEKQIKLVVEACNNVILEQARDIVNQNTDEVREKGIDPTSLAWITIANLPPATRKGSAISDEKWEAFEVDYVNVMVHHGKTEDKAKTGAKLLSKRFQPVKTNKKVVKALKENLALWFTNSEQQEEFADVYETLQSKADTLLEADEDALMQAI